MTNPSDFGFIGNIAVSIPGLLFLTYLVDLLYRIKWSLPLSVGLKNLLASNESIATTLFVIIGIAIGAYIFLYGLRIYSNAFSKIFPEMKETDPSHNFWRQFSISGNFAITLILIIEIFYIAFSSLSLLTWLLVAFIITFVKTFLLHKDIKIKKVDDKQKEKWKTFNWDAEIIDKGYYTPLGVAIIAKDQNEWIKKFENK